MSDPHVAVFRPDDDRLSRAVDTLSSLGADPVADPMLAIEPTGLVPRTDADVTVLTSVTGADLVAEAGWQPDSTHLCAIGPATAQALEDRGYSVNLVPDTFTSSGLVDAIRDASAIDGRTIEVARSDHGSATLIEGLVDGGGFVHETILYELVRPPESGDSTRALIDGALDGVCFTSSLTVEHFLEAAEEREAVLAALEEVVVGAIGEPTASTATAHGIAVDVVPERQTFEALAAAVVERIDG